MIPHTPLLLVSVTHALARHGLQLRREHPELPCSLEFVSSVGGTSHLDLGVGVSNWPVTHLATFDDLRRMSVRRRWGRLGVEAGDLLLMRNDPMQAITTEPVPPIEEVGVVLEVYDRNRASIEGVRRCLVAIAREHEGGGMQVDTCLRLSDTRGRDLAIRWYATFDDIERAA